MDRSPNCALSLLVFGATRPTPIMAAAQEMLDFKTFGAKSIYSGASSRSFRPELAAHVRREAVGFIYELKRAKA